MGISLQRHKNLQHFLENVDRVTAMDATLKARMKAEARFIRAFHYFMLETWWGDVPLFDKDISIDEIKKHCPHTKSTGC
ncbi:RagB/SusD family nutrient uptake outer membrane protein [Mucilaginibacter sp. P19]|uniref:RagB/SusD family nutrient uptake outer membrane protein n=1 Tax=Mucilaginibacter sp. P19 TaxID=3423947 RepID=UPI003D67CF21